MIKVTNRYLQPEVLLTCYGLEVTFASGGTGNQLLMWENYIATMS